MIRTEQIGSLVKTWSDENRYIVNDATGEIYGEAIDPIAMGRTYHEGDPIPVEEPVEFEPIQE